MKKLVVIVAAVAVAVCSISAVAAQSEDPDRGVRTSTEDLRYGQIVVRPPSEEFTAAPEPAPGPFPTPTTGEAALFEFVGVTSQRIPGDRGVLNMSLACRAEFVDSRMCRISEMFQSLNIPTQIGDQSAWILPDSPSQLVSASTCNGWTSSSDGNTGLAMKSDSCCYGGIVNMTCDAELSVACCAPMPRE
jgi:hypothetical protein